MRGLAFSPNNLTLAAACDDKSIIDLERRSSPPASRRPRSSAGRCKRYAHDGAANDLIFAADSTMLYSAGADKAVKQWKVASEVPIKTFPHPREVDAVAFDLKGERAGDRLPRRQRAPLRRRQGDRAEGHQGPAPQPLPSNETNPVYCVVWNPAGTQVLSGSKDASLKLWDAAGGTLVKEFKAYKEKDFEKGHREPVFCAAFSPDGKTIASGSAGLERTIKIWNVADGSVVRDLVNPNLKVPARQPAAVAPRLDLRPAVHADGKYLVSVGEAPKRKGYLAVWSVADGKMLYGEELALGSFYSLSLSPDGKQIAARRRLHRRRDAGCEQLLHREDARGGKVRACESMTGSSSWDLGGTP